MSEQQTAHCCPVCGGNGLVSGGFYNQVSGFGMSTTISEQCRSCQGTGIVWGKKHLEESIDG